MYCASSNGCDPAFHRDARRLGALLAEHGHWVVYGGGSAGSMGHVADGALESGGKVMGVIPGFMHELEWTHENLTELIVCDDMRERKKIMLDNADAVVCLPGGCGTYDEFFEVLSFKRLGLFFGPVVLVNTQNAFAPLQALLDQTIHDSFMNPQHADMWQLVESPDHVPAELKRQTWHKDARSFAGVGR